MTSNVTNAEASASIQTAIATLVQEVTMLSNSAFLTMIAVLALDAAAFVAFGFVAAWAWDRRDAALIAFWRNEK